MPGTRLWIPLSAQAVLTAPEIAPTSAARDERRLLVFGRLAASVTVATASAEVAAIAAALDRTYPPLNGSARARATERPWRAKSATAIAEQDSIFRRFGIVLVALVALVLVVACTNLANLVLARGTARQQDIAVRYALGASRARLIREQCAESLLVLIAGTAATYVVFVSLRVLLAGEFQMTLPMGEQWALAFRPEIDPAVLGAASAALLISLIVFGLEPAVQLTRSRDIRGELSTAAVPRAGRQRTLLRWQVAISAGFFIIATMFVQYSVAEARHDSGVSLERLGVAVLDLRTQRWEEARVRRTLDRIVEEAQRAPGVEMVSVSAGMPFGIRNGIRLALSVPGETKTGTRGAHSATAVAATPSIFKTLGVPISQGRSFDDGDHAGAAPVVVVSEFTARTLFGTSIVVGRQLALGGHGSASQPARIIGIARDTDVGQLLREPRSLVYLPLAQRYDAFLTIAARSTGDPALAVRALRVAIRRADPDLPIQVSGTGRTVLAGPFVFLRAAGLAALALGALTLLLAMAGLFGIHSHIVAHRTREIGVRISLGATAGQIRRMVLNDGCRPVVEGLAIGLFIGLAGRAIVRSYVDIDVAIVDPWMLVVPVPLIAAALGACYLPAHRAATVDPNVALRHL